MGWYVRAADPVESCGLGTLLFCLVPSPRGYATVGNRLGTFVLPRRLVRVRILGHTAGQNTKTIRLPAPGINARDERQSAQRVKSVSFETIEGVATARAKSESALDVFGAFTVGHDLVEARHGGMARRVHVPAEERDPGGPEQDFHIEP
jgi:hypothetical protein